jgi:hypothetical protein
LFLHHIVVEREGFLNKRGRAQRAILGISRVGNIRVSKGKRAKDQSQRMGSNGVANGEGKFTAVQKLRNMLADPNKFIACPGVYDGFTARIALREGVDCLYMVSFHPHHHNNFR